MLKNLTSAAIFIAPDLPPPLLAKALAGGSAPVNAGRSLLFIYILSALAAPYFKLVGKDFNLGAAVLALIQRHPEVAAVLSGALAVHSNTLSHSLYRYLKDMIE